MVMVLEMPMPRDAILKTKNNTNINMNIVRFRTHLKFATTIQQNSLVWNCNFHSSKKILIYFRKLKYIGMYLLTSLIALKFNGLKNTWREL